MPAMFLLSKLARLTRKPENSGNGAPAAETEQPALIDGMLPSTVRAINLLEELKR